MHLSEKSRENRSLSLGKTRNYLYWDASVVKYVTF